MTGNTNGLISRCTTPPASLTINAMLLTNYPLNEPLAEVGLVQNSHWAIWVHCQKRLNEQFCIMDNIMHNYLDISRYERMEDIFLAATLHTVHTQQASHVLRLTKCSWRRQASDPMMALILPNRCRECNYCSYNYHSSQCTAGFCRKRLSKKNPPELCWNEQILFGGILKLSHRRI